jgi:PBSX family phage terminase large subunit
VSPELSSKQLSILTHYWRETPKLLILEGAVRSGKTVLNNVLFYTETKRHIGEGLHYIITGHTLGSIKRNVLDSMAEMFGVDCKTDNAGTFELWGNKVHCFGADKADSYKAITGMTAHGWLANEVTLQHENSIRECFNRCSGADARMWWDTNPDYPTHPVKIDYIDHSGKRLSNGRLRVQSWHFNLDDNPYLPSDYVENLKASTPAGMWYDRAIKGQWVAAEGLVYGMFDRETHGVEPFTPPEDWRRIRSIDFGFKNAFVCLWGAIDHDGRLYVYDEHYRAEALIAEHASEIHKRGGAEWTISDHDAQERAELHAKGIATQSAIKDVSLGLQRVAERLVVQPDGYPRLFVSGVCVNLLREFGMYVWEPPKDGKPVKEEPRKEHDHAMDALRYMVMALDKGKSGAGDVTAGELGL